MMSMASREVAAERSAYLVSGQLFDALVRENSSTTRREADVEEKRSRLEFVLNGELVSEMFDEGMETMTLASFLRARGLTGTKLSCAEGGCGACTVLLQDTTSGNESWRPVNACLRLLGSCHAMRIVTAEGIGGHGKPLDPMQSGLADGCGSQCGFCSPGMVASGVALRSKLRSMQRAGVDIDSVRAEVEKSLDGNICRCTGYLPIVDSLTKIIETDLHRCAEEGRECTGICEDIEEICGSKKRSCAQQQQYRGSVGATVTSRLSGPRWESPQALDELLDLMRENGGTERLKLVAGNTGSGVAKYYDIRGGDNTNASLIVDIQHVKELTEVGMISRGDGTNTKELRVGSAVTIAHFLDFLALHRTSDEQTTTTTNGVIESLHEYVSCVANTQVRSVGTVGGNVCLASICPSFPSDIALALTATGATAVLVSPATSETTEVSIGALLSQGIRDQLLLGFRISVDDYAVLMAMRVSKRRVNAHAVVNFALGLRLVPSHSSASANDGWDRDAKTLIDTAPIIVFGGISPTGYTRATDTEVFLSGKDLTQPGVLSGAMHALAADLKLAAENGAMMHDNANATAKDVAMGLFYRGLLRALPRSSLPADLVTAAYPPPKPPVSGAVSYAGDTKEYPVSEGMVKLSAALQTSGEALYTDDFVPSVAPTCLHVAHLLSMHGNARIASIDGNAAMALDSSVEIIDAVTLKENGLTNTFSTDEPYLLTAGDRVSYNGQVIALVVASSKQVATKAASLVRVEYADIQTPITTIDEAIAAGSFYPAGEDATLTKGDAAQAMVDADMCVEGVAECLHQYHFYMETQTCLAVPSEGGQMKIKASTQSPSSVQTCIASVLGVAANKVTVEMKRAGGGYGGKGERSIPPAVHAAIACRITGKPVSVVMDINTNMLAVGSRRPHKATFKAAITNGRISGLEINVFNLQGAFSDQGDVPSLIVSVAIDGVYNVPNWAVFGKCCKSNTAANTSCRGPAWLPGTYLIESIFDTVAARLGESSAEDFKRNHFYSQGQMTPTGQKLEYFTLPRIWESVLESAEFSRRRSDIDTFNAGSRFVKRGIAATPMKYGIGWSGNKFSSLISIYGDGTVLLSHAGCEIGQGIDVKIAQVCAYMLGCPIEMIEVSQVSTTTAANCSGTGGSHTSENNAQAVKNACDVINQRLGGIDRSNKSWVGIIAEAMDKGIDLQARGRFAGGPSPDGPFQYCSFGVGVNEVQVDLLTGEAVVLRTDLLLDCGISLNPDVDLGQAQGGFVMGLGYMLTEEFEYSRGGVEKSGAGGGTGKLISNGTWEYKPPSAQDVPSVLNVSLLKDAPNPLGFLHSKASGEPPLLMSVGVISAIRDAIRAYKDDARSGSASLGGMGLVQAPATPLRITEAAGIDPLVAFRL